MNFFEVSSHSDPVTDLTDTAETMIRQIVVGTGFMNRAWVEWTSVSFNAILLTLCLILLWFRVDMIQYRDELLIQIDDLTATVDL